MTADPTILHETSLPFRRRPSALVLPEDPSKEELAQYWTLSTRDKAEVFQCRSEVQRRRFALQLCALRTYGRFLPKAMSAPAAITNYLARQLDLPLALFGEVPERLATETDHLQRIRTYPGWRPFDDEARERFTRWLTQRATDDVLPHDLVARAEDILRNWQIILPAPSTLEELVASVTVRVQDEIYTRILIGLTPELLRAMDDLLQVPSGERHSMLFQLTEYPPETSSAVILRYITRYHFLQDLGVGAIDLHRVNLPMIRYFAEVTKRYDVRALRRFPPGKRYALTACFLVEVHKTILYHMVALHAQDCCLPVHANRRLSPRLRRGISLRTTTIPISGLYHAACHLAPHSSAPPLLVRHVGFTTDRLAMRSSGGTCTYCAHPLGHHNQFHECSPNLKVSGFLGASPTMVRTCPMHTDLLDT